MWPCSITSETMLTHSSRVFWESGFKSVAAVANADPRELLPVLMQAQPNKIRLKGQAEEKYEDKLMAKANIISNGANRLWRGFSISVSVRVLANESQKSRCKPRWTWNNHHI